MARRTIDGKRMLITGASSGIGQALALEAARRGAMLVVNARRAERLNEVAAELERLGAEVEVVVGDVTQDATLQLLRDRTLERFGGLDVLVNNAGIGAVGTFEHGSGELLRQVFEINLFAPAELIRITLPLLKQGQRPIVVNLGSVLAHRAVGRMSEYCASKYALRGLSDSLRIEFRRWGIDVLHVSPSRTDSEFFDQLLGQQGEALWPELPRASAETVARRTMRAIERGRAEYFPSWSGTLLGWANRLAPRAIERYLMHYEA